MERTGGNTDFSRQMSQFGRGMAEFGRLMAEWGRQMGDAGRQMSQDISRRMTEDLSHRMSAEANGQPTGQPAGPAGQPTGGAGQPPSSEGSQATGESVHPPSLSEMGRRLGEELGQQMGDYSRRIGDSGRQLGDTGSNVVNINVTCSINDVHNGSSGPPFGLCNSCVPFSSAVPCSPFGAPSPMFSCAPNSASTIIEGILNGPRTVFELMADSRKFQDAVHGSRNNQCLKWVTTNDDGGRLLTKITGTGSGECELAMKNGVATVEGFPVDTTIPCFTKRYEPEDGKDAKKKLVIELDTFRFKGDDIRVTPEKGLVNVHIVHNEQLPNGAEMQQVYDMPCPLPEGDTETDDLISYFSDGEKLTIDIHVR